MHPSSVSASDSPDSPAGRVPRKKRETRERLYEAAVSLFAEKGYDAATMDDIAARADTARGTAFNHFPTKGHFAFEWTARRRDRARSAMESLTDPEAPIGDRLRAYFHELARINAEEFRLTRQMVIGWVRAGGPIEDEPWLADELVAYLEQGRSRGELRASASSTIAACVLRDAYLGLVFRWIREPEGPAFHFVGALDELIDLLLQGIVGQPTLDHRPPRQALRGGPS